MDGRIYKGGTLFPNTAPFLVLLKQLGIGYSFLTNDPSKSVPDYLEHLEKMGLSATRGELYTSAMATVDHLRRHYPHRKRIFALITPSMLAEFSAAGFELTGDHSTAESDATFVSFDLTPTYSRLCRAAWWIERGKLFVATNPDRVCPTNQPTVFFEFGSICAVLEKATGRGPDVVLGKPDPAMHRAFLVRHGLQPHQVAMAGNRIYTDILVAQRANTLGVRVLSGDATAADVARASPPPDLVLPSLSEFGQLLFASRDQAPCPCAGTHQQQRPCNPKLHNRQIRPSTLRTEVHGRFPLAIDRRELRDAAVAALHLLQVCTDARHFCAQPF